KMKLLVSLLLTIPILACSDFDKFYQEKGGANKDSVGSSTVVAKIGGELITKKDLIESLDGLTNKQRANYLSSPERLKEYLDSLINQIVLYKDAEKRGIDKRKGIKENIESYERRVLIQAISQDILGRQISEEEIKNYYDKNPIDFSEIRMSQIFIKANPEQGISKDEARTIAWLVVNRANSGESFEELVGFFSDDPSSKRREGDIGYISGEMLPKYLEDKIFSFKAGEISNPIETEDGFLIIKVTENPKILPFEQVKDRIQVELRKKEFSDYTKKLREQIGVEVFEDNLKKISQNG
ncbi:MAG: peptidylprolyl isomerase, partial [Candidatus Dadabacteria bacterium]|nr:peptidylprolyl isomerase [Candidatus Dadabacteria bacterium]